MPRSIHLKFLSFLFSGLLAFTVSATDMRPLQYKALNSKSVDTAITPINRKQWSLTEPEWQRYQDLMQGIRGSISPKNLSPIEVLGTHARSDEERRKYARQWATMMHEDIARILAFQKAYDEAWQALYPNENIIDVSKLDLKTQRYQDGDRILVFTRLKNCKACNIQVKRVIQQTQALNIQLDIYFLDSNEKSDDHLIRSWAKEQKLDTQRLKTGRLTLNHDKGTLLAVTGKLTFPNQPLFYRLRDQFLQAIQPES